MNKEMIAEAADRMMDVYRTGFDKPGSYRILRSNIGTLLNIKRVEKPTMQSLHDTLREEGFLLLPLDQDDYSKAQTWILQRLSQLEKRPLADEEVLNGESEE